MEVLAITMRTIVRKVMKAYGFDTGMSETYLNDISAEKIISVGRRFGADYAVLPKTERCLRKD